MHSYVTEHDRKWPNYHIEKKISHRKDKIWALHLLCGFHVNPRIDHDFQHDKIRSLHRVAMTTTLKCRQLNVVNIQEKAARSNIVLQTHKGQEVEKKVPH